MSRLRRDLLAVLTIAALLAAGCGTTEDALPEDDAATGDPVTFTDSRGKEITLDAPAQRVVALEWGEAERLVTLGVMPFGVADVARDGTGERAAPLDADVVDVGTRQEPDVVAVVELEP